MTDPLTPRDSSAARAIIAEAARDDSRPLYYVAGGGLTDVASACLLDPQVAERLVLVWIGGPERTDLALPPPGSSGPEYNLNIDIPAAQFVFNESMLPLWQVPRDVYRQCLVSDIELRERVLPHGRLGHLLYESLREVQQRMALRGHGASETYVLGDSPLVLLTALQSFFEPDPSSSRYKLVAAPHIDTQGDAQEGTGGRVIRVYTQVDQRLMFEDLFLKVAAFARWSTGGERET